MDKKEEKLGVYRREYINRNQDNRNAYKHCNKENYLFHFTNSGWSGWVIGPELNVGRGGLMIESDSVCPESTSAGGWSCYNETGFFPDSTITVSCFDEGYLDGKKLMFRYMASNKIMLSFSQIMNLILFFNFRETN